MEKASWNKCYRPNSLPDIYWFTNKINFAHTTDIDVPFVDHYEMKSEKDNLTKLTHAHMKKKKKIILFPRIFIYSSLKQLKHLTSENKYAMGAISK